VTEKGVDTFIDALALRPEIHGVIVGAGPERENLEARVREHGIADRVTFTGVLPAEDALRAVGMLDVLVLPSRTRPNWAEQFGRVLIEAMASNVVVVASDSGAIAEVLGDAGIVVPEDDVPAFASALGDAFEPAHAALLRARGRLRVADKYTYDHAAEVLDGALKIAALRKVAS
jgi:glycosyltransferase involved in cell wall biosynthesis